MALEFKSDSLWWSEGKMALKLVSGKDTRLLEKKDAKCKQSLVEKKQRSSMEKNAGGWWNMSTASSALEKNASPDGIRDGTQRR